MNIRAKFQCSSAEKSGDNEYNTQENVSLHPVVSGSKENESFSRWTPSGSLLMTITNPSAFGFFEAGKEYYLDISKAGE